MTLIPIYHTPEAGLLELMRHLKDLRDITMTTVTIQIRLQIMSNTVSLAQEWNGLEQSIIIM
jgi:hypothetical protein